MISRPLGTIADNKVRQAIEVVTVECPTSRGAFGEAAILIADVRRLGIHAL